jgi:hypothetical protein
MTNTVFIFAIALSIITIAASVILGVFLIYINKKQ